MDGPGAHFPTLPNVLQVMLPELLTVYSLPDATEEAVVGGTLTHASDSTTLEEQYWLGAGGACKLVRCG
jgi:hypothetical protein